MERRLSELKDNIRTYKNKRLFIVDTIEKDEDSKKSKLSDRQFNTFIRKVQQSQFNSFGDYDSNSMGEVLRPRLHQGKPYYFSAFPLMRNTN